jgi:hypothetical protein
MGEIRARADHAFAPVCNATIGYQREAGCLPFRKPAIQPMLIEPGTYPLLNSADGRVSSRWYCRLLQFFKRLKVQ